jgi:hypothetical protein
VASLSSITLNTAKRRKHFSRPKRPTPAGLSYMKTLLAAEGNRGFKAALAISPAAQNWDHNAPLRARLIAGAAKVNIPVYLMQPPRDASLGPARDLVAEFTRLKKAYRGKVWPDTLSAREAGHCFGGDAGITCGLARRSHSLIRCWRGSTRVEWNRRSRLRGAYCHATRIIAAPDAIATNPAGRLRTFEPGSGSSGR